MEIKCEDVYAIDKCIVLYVYPFAVSANKEKKKKVTDGRNAD